MYYSIKKIASAIDADAKLHQDSDIQYLLTDSRTVYYPKESLFFALETSTNNGHKYINDLYKQGVRNFVIRTFSEEWNAPDANFLVVKDTLTALQTLAKKHRENFQIPIVAITGSNGKTIVKEWLNQLLQEDSVITRSPKSYNSQIGVPLSIWQLNKSSQIGIFEAGISQTSEMSKLAPIIQPEIGIFTNLGEAHQENFNSLEEKLQEKLLLFKNSKVLIYKKDVNVERIMQKNNRAVQLFAWSEKEDANVKICNIKKQEKNSIVDYQYEGKKYNYSLPFVDDASIENSINCLTFCLFFGLKPEVINARINKLEPVGMRLEVKKGINDCSLINDTYNSVINSLNIALDLLVYSSGNKQDKRTLILSDIIQSGEKDENLYKRVADSVRQKNISKIIGIGETISQFSNLFSCEKHFFKDTESFLASDLMDSFFNEAILLKGARQFYFERISSRLEQKRHETVMEINLNALVHNFNFLRSKLKPETKTMCMIKANAYGCGAIDVAKTLQYHRCDYFGVAVADEGAELRKAGIYTPIIVMNPEPSCFSVLFENKLEPEIYSFNLLREFSKKANEEGVVNYPIHIKIDTGMHRLGFNPEDMEQLVKELKNNHSVQVQSVFSHLVGSDETRFNDFTEQQIKIFSECSSFLQEHTEHYIIRHILNSAGVQRFAENQFDMVRLGIALYGVGSEKQTEIEHLATLKTIILQIKDIKATDTVGYSRNGKLTRDSRIAAIPIGYADGLRRSFGNGNGYVLVNGQRASFVGNICMDISMIDITEIDDVKEGDPVIIFGNDLTIETLAEKVNTIPYEILTGVSQRVKRVYFQE